jgi:hypothetical protein
MNIDYSPSFEDMLISDIRDWGIDNIEDSFSMSLTDLTDKYWDNKTSVWEGNELDLILEAEGSEPIVDLETTYGEQPYE